SSFYTLRPPTSPLFPYTTLFRSARAQEGVLDDPLHLALFDARTDALAERLERQVAQGGRGPHILHLLGALDTAQRAEVRVQVDRSEEHTSELQSRFDLVCRLLLE